MATIDKKLIHFNRKADFETRLAAGDIRDYSIVCIKDAKLIWTHGQYYGDLSGCLKVTEQQLSEEEKAQVKLNLGIEEGGQEPMVSVQWGELKEMRDAGLLVPGTWYRITDYETTTSQSDTRSAGHGFDVVVLATGKESLSEEARAVKREGDTYFTERKENPGSWKIWYCLDNDRLRFPWALNETGNRISVELESGLFYTAEYMGEHEVDGSVYHRWEGFTEGVLFYFLTESGIPQAGDLVLYLGMPDYGVEEPVEAPIAEFLEGSSSEGKGVVYRLIDENRNDLPYDFKNIQFVRKTRDMNYDPERGTDEWVYTFCEWVDGEWLDSSSGFYTTSNTMGPYLDGLNDNVLFVSSYYNCRSNTFGNNCYSNTSDYGFNNNTLGDVAFSNTFMNSCHSNTFGNNCHSNTFGNSCHSNTFGNGCGSNTFGNDCDSNTFGNNCCSNTFSDGCHSNTFGNDCNENTFENDCIYNTFGYNCSSNTFEGPAMRYKVCQGIHNTVIPVDIGRQYETRVAYNSNGELKIYCEADLIN